MWQFAVQRRLQSLLVLSRQRCAIFCLVSRLLTSFNIIFPGNADEGVRINNCTGSLVIFAFPVLVQATRAGRQVPGIKR